MFVFLSIGAMGYNTVMESSIFHKQLYADIEKEVLDLGFEIFFDEQQLYVYSTHIAKIFMDVSNNIESISMDLYKKLGGTRSNISYKTRLIYINKQIGLSTKLLLFLNSYTNFSPEQRIVSPFKDWLAPEKTDSSNSVIRPAGWYLAYQYLKHSKLEDRYLSMQRYGTLHYLLEAMSALYLLNCYNSSSNPSNCSSLKSSFFAPIYLRDDGTAYVWKEAERMAMNQVLSNELSVVVANRLAD